MDANDSKLLDLLVRRSYLYRPERPFVLASGRTSPVYVDCRLTTTFADAMPLIGRAFFERVASATGGTGVDAVGGLTLGADPIAANIVSILACGALNFGASEWLVFRRATAAAVLALTVQPLFAAAPAGGAGSVDLRPHTVQAWKAYEQRVDMRYEGATATASPFFALDAFGAKDWRSTATRGTVAMSRIESSRPGDGEPARPPQRHPGVPTVLGEQVELQVEVGPAVGVAESRLARRGDPAKDFEAGVRTELFAESRPVTVNVNVPAAVGVPLRSPLELRSSPPGSVPDVTCQMSTFWPWNCTL